MISTISNWVVAYFFAYRKMCKTQFIWRITIEGLFVPILIGSAVSFIFDFPHRTDFDSYSTIKLLIIGIVVAPIVETLILQALPVMIARRFGQGFWGCVIASIIPFSCAHIPSGIDAFISAGLLSGFYLAFTYVHLIETSLWDALWLTAISHAVHNLVILGVIILYRL